MSNIFVFVVCGAKEHIDTLHFSLTYLKKYTKHAIYVITDGDRNEIPVEHNHIIHIKTPETYTNHQASIYLKTGIHQFLPKGNTYCYLDTDVIALSEACDNIFNQFKSPIIFAPDHCKVRKFSAYAVNCNCLKNRETDREKFHHFMKEINNVTITNTYLIEQGKALQYEFDKLKTKPFKRLFTAARFFLSTKIFRFNNQFYFDKKTRTWHINSGEVIMYDVDVERMQKATGLAYNKWTKKWYNKLGEDIWFDECNHLTDYIKNTFNIDVNTKNWQHWNGGVFVFNDSSHAFLDAWHKKTMHIFNLPQWKTRDQGTLIATAWEFGLSNHQTLSKQYNFIADYYNNGVQINANENLITDDGFITSYKPAFVHVYHHWMDNTWPIWQWITTK